MVLFAALALALHVQQSSYDPLDGVSMQVAVDNTGHAPQIVRFAQPSEYELDVLHDGHVVWSSRPAAPPDASFPVHARTFVPGASVLVVYIWNAIEDDGSAPAPGVYTIRARLLGESRVPAVSTTVRFMSPTPVAALTHLKDGDVVTIAGMLDASKGVLTDASGSVRLARRIPGAPAGRVAIRGYLFREPNRSNAFFIQRWAPMP